MLASLLWLLCISFSGLAVKPDDLPTFWEFMYRVSPCNYLISGIMSAGLTGSGVTCAASEILHMEAPGGMTCGEFLAPFVAANGGTIIGGGGGGGGTGGQMCAYCPIATTDAYLAEFRMFYSEAWRNFGIGWSYIVANVVLTFLFFWVFRVPKGKKQEKQA